MSDDLVKRLRDNCTCNFPDTPCGAEEECRNAFEGADRIQELEAALREIIGALDDPKGGQHVYDMRNASYIARKALEGKDE
jgi:hypothetical protein